MATSSGGGVGEMVSLKAADSFATKQYYPVKLTAAFTCGTVSATTDEEIGIMQGDPAQNEWAAVQINGLSKVVTGGTIAAGARATFGTDGRLVAALTADAANSRYNYLAFEASTTTAANGGGDIITVVRQPTIGTTS